MKFEGFHHTLHPHPPRYNLVEKPLTVERATEMKEERIREAEEALRAAIEAPLEEFEMGFVRVTEDGQKTTPNPAYESATVEHPITLHSLILSGQVRRNFSSEIPAKKFQFLSDALKTKIEIAP